MFHVSLSAANKMCRVFAWSASRRFPERALFIKPIVPFHNLHFYRLPPGALFHFIAIWALILSCSIASKFIQLIQLLRFSEHEAFFIFHPYERWMIQKYFSLNFTGDLCLGVWRKGEGGMRISETCSYDDAIHASAAFIASNSFTFISHLIFQRNFPAVEIELN